MKIPISGPHDGNLADRFAGDCIVSHAVGLQLLSSRNELQEKLPGRQIIETVTEACRRSNRIARLP
jgi:hypothetical protein